MLLKESQRRFPLTCMHLVGDAYKSNHKFLLTFPSAR
jgi:hypothetical protein